MNALKKIRELPVWPEICVLLDKILGAHDERTELELLMTMLVLQAAEQAERRAVDQVNDLVAELRGIVASIARGAPVPVHLSHDDSIKSVMTATDTNNAQG